MNNNDELERQAFEEWFESEWRDFLIKTKTPTFAQRQFMNMGWYGWQARAEREAVCK